jgi:hypothetical protein
MASHAGVGLYLYAAEDGYDDDEVEEEPVAAVEQQEPMSVPGEEHSEGRRLRGAYAPAPGEGGEGDSCGPDAYSLLLADDRAHQEEGYVDVVASSYEDVLAPKEAAADATGLPRWRDRTAAAAEPRSLTDSIERIARSELDEDEADAVYEHSISERSQGDGSDAGASTATTRDGGEAAATTSGDGNGTLDGSDSNERFQRWMSSKDSLEKYVLLSQHARDFVHAASTFGTS